MDNGTTRQFKGVWIPAYLWDATDITWSDKCLLAEIHALTGEEGCYASNEYLAAKFNVTEATMKNKLTYLRKKGYLITVKFDGRRRWMKVCWDINGEVTKNMTNKVTKTMTPKVMESVTHHHIVENKEREDSSSSKTTTTNDPSILFDDQVFEVADVPDNAWDKVESFAVRYGVSQDRIPDLVNYIAKHHIHLRIPANGRIYGLDKIIDHWITQSNELG